jgi:hypothetical protein
MACAKIRTRIQLRNRHLKTLERRITYFGMSPAESGNDGPMLFRVPAEFVLASYLAAIVTDLLNSSSPSSTTRAHSRLGQHSEDTHLGLKLGPVRKVSFKFRVLSLVLS